MALNRLWMPSPSYSSRGGASVRLIVIHTAEGARTIESLGNWFANPANQVSSHAGADDQPGTVGEYVRRPDKAWTQGDANPQAVSLELCGFAAWDNAEWHRHPAMLENCAAWVAEEAQAFGVPIVRLDADQAQGGGTGVCQHIDLGQMGGGHVDCGAGFPMEEVLAMAGGAPPAISSPPASPPAAGVAPPWPGRYLKYPPIMQGTDVHTWQAQMAARGWTLDVDGAYGSQSASVCAQFQAEKDLEPVDGIVGPATWAAAWAAPVT